MGSGISDYGAANWPAALFGVQPIPTGYYIALVNSEPGAAMDGNILADLEPSAPEYHRPRYGIGAANWGVADDFLVSLNDLTWGLAANDWDFLTHYVLCTAPTGGDIFAWGELLNPTFVQSGFYVTLPAGGMVIALSALEASIAV